MRIYSRLIALLAAVAFFSVASYAATSSTSSTGASTVAATTTTSTATPAPSNSVTADGVTVTTLAAPTPTTTSTTAATSTSPAATTTDTAAQTTASAPATTTTTDTSIISNPSTTSIPSTTQMTASAATPAVAAPTVTAAAPQQVPASTVDMQTQPTTVIEAAPIAESNAEQLQQLEKQTELQTEQKIEDKLEQARIAAEEQRQREILNSMNKLMPAISQATTATAAQPTAAQTPTAPTTSPTVVVVAPAAALPNQNTASTTSQNSSASETTTPQDVQNMVKEDLAKIAKPKTSASSYYVGATLGQINYHQSNVTSFGAFMLSLGEKFPSNVDLSVDFGYSNNNLTQDAFVFQNMDQYTAGLTARYVFFNGRIQPSLGGALDYVRRQYSGLQDTFGNYYQNYYNGGSIGNLTSDAVDAGLVADLDLKVSPQFSVGVDYRYMMNVGYKYEGQNILNTAAYRNYNGGIPPLEQTNYDLTSLVIRYLF